MKVVSLLEDVSEHLISAFGLTVGARVVGTRFAVKNAILGEDLGEDSINEMRSCLGRSQFPEGSRSGKTYFHKEILRW